MNLKKIFFNLHNLGIYVVNFGWIISNYFIYIHLIVILSWYFNNNNCIISQIENKIFGETFMNNNKCYVPFQHRLLLYINFFFGTIYYIVEYLLCKYNKFHKNQF